MVTTFRTKTKNRGVFKTYILLERLRTCILFCNKFKLNILANSRRQRQQATSVTARQGHIEKYQPIETLKYIFYRPLTNNRFYF